jgi:Oxidoreductase family, NAD-binding Rossmann fold/Oxidoreductase family, C-terminal alpha/beta domain
MSDISRRTFVTTAAAAGAGLTIVPRHVLGHGFQAPSDTVNIATVGVGGMGRSNTMALTSQNIVAFCDVDDTLLDSTLKQIQGMAAKAPAQGQRPFQGRPGMPAQRPPSKAQLAANERRPRVDRQATLKRFADEQLPRLKRYRDYREMLEKQKDLDAIVVATPDHMHAAIATAAMDVGKHVYVQKPLCWSVEEARALAKKAQANRKVVTQMGNQGHSSDGARTGYELIRSGAIGDILEVHVWTNRPLGFWPQGIPRPAPVVATPDPQRSQPWNGNLVTTKLTAALYDKVPVPSTLSWDLFLGVAPEVEYHPIYHPFNWRGWVDWGQGALGDMGAHLVDHPFWALNLGYPTTIETLSTPFNGVCFPLATTTYYQFPARGNMPAVKLTWYDGGLTPPKPEEIGEEPLNGEGGILYIGTKGKMLQNTYGHNPRLLPTSLNDSVGEPKQMLPRITHAESEHEMNWVEAIKGKAEISSPFEYAGPLTEVMLLGIVALRAGGKIHYDGANQRVTNTIKGRGGAAMDPNQFLKREYRSGWKLT